MSRTIQAIAAHQLRRAPKGYAAGAQDRPLVGQWQDGLEAISGYATRKLRLTLASGKEDDLGGRKFQLAPSHFRLLTPAAITQTGPGTTLGLSAKEQLT